MTITLEPEERLLRKAYGSFINQRWKFPTDGRIYLTSQRLVWTRALLQIPGLAPPRVEIPLALIADCKVTAPVLIIFAGETEYWLYVRAGILARVHWVHGKTTREWCAAILDAVKEARGG